MSVKPFLNDLKLKNYKNTEIRFGTYAHIYIGLNLKACVCVGMYS